MGYSRERPPPLIIREVTKQPRFQQPITYHLCCIHTRCVSYLHTRRSGPLFTFWSGNATFKTLFYYTQLWRRWTNRPYNGSLMGLLKQGAMFSKCHLWYKVDKLQPSNLFRSWRYILGCFSFPLFSISLRSQRWELKAVRTAVGVCQWF